VVGLSANGKVEEDVNGGYENCDDNDGDNDGYDDFNPLPVIQNHDRGLWVGLCAKLLDTKWVKN